MGHHAFRDVKYKNSDELNKIHRCFDMRIMSAV